MWRAVITELLPLAKSAAKTQKRATWSVRRGTSDSVKISGDGGREVRDEVDEVKRSAVEPTCRNSIAFGGVSLLLGVWRSCVVPGSGQSKC